MDKSNKNETVKGPEEGAELEPLYLAEDGDDATALLNALHDEPSKPATDDIEIIDVAEAQCPEAEPSAATLRAARKKAKANARAARTQARRDARAAKKQARLEAKAARKAAKESGEKTLKKPRKAKDSHDVENWRKGIKGRPAQVFIGFLSDASKKDAIRYAIGVAEQNAVSFVNAAYAVFPWNGGWAYEVHEGGPFRAYLPAILRFFDGQGEHTKPEDMLVTISTARRSVRVERTHTGLISFQMPEHFEGEQTPWLEPGPRLKAAAPVRLGVLGFGGAILGTGFLAMIAALMVRPDAPVIQAKKQDIPYEHLPISLWETLVNIYQSGKYVNAMQFADGKYTFSVVGEAGPIEMPPTPSAPASNEQKQP